MKKLKVKLKDTTFKFALISFITGILILIYSNLIFNYVEDKNIGERFKSNEFLESDLFIIIGAFQVLNGLLYFLTYFKGKFYLIDKATIRSY